MKLDTEELIQRVLERYASVEDLVTELDLMHLYDEDDLNDLTLDEFVEENRGIIKRNADKLDIY